MRDRLLGCALLRQLESRGAAAVGWSVAALVFLLPVSSPDIFWHLSAARWMAEQLAVPRADWLSHTMAGAPWVDFEWLTQLFWGAAFKAAGLWGLLAAKAVALAVAGFLVWRLAGARQGAGAAAAALACLSLALMPANDLRPDNLSIAFFAFLLWLLERRGKSRPAWKFYAELFALFCLWTNAHAAFPLGWLLVLLYTRDAKAVVVAVAAALVNPYGLGYAQVFSSHGATAGYLLQNAEWRSAFAGAPTWSQALWRLPAWLLLAAAALEWPRAKSGPLKWATLALAGATLAQIRILPYFTVCAAVFAAPLLSRWWRPVLAAAAAAAALFVAPRVRQAPFEARYAPVEAEFFIASHPELSCARMLNPSTWGGYLGYHLWPRCRVFADGRYLFHPLIEQRQAAQAASPQAFRAFLDRYDIDLFVTKRNSQDAALRDAYLPPATWTLAHEDSQAQVFARTHRFAAIRGDPPGRQGDRGPAKD